MDVDDHSILWRILDVVWLPILLCINYHIGAYFPTLRLSKLVGASLETCFYS